MFTLFILDFDEMYGNEDRDSTGMPPQVYLVDTDKITEVYRCAYAAQEMFYDDNNQEPIGDIFIGFLVDANIRYQYVGELDSLTFGERDMVYLDDQIEFCPM